MSSQNYALKNETDNPSAARDPNASLTPDQILKAIKLDRLTLEQLDAKVREFINVVVNSDIHTAPFQEKVNAIHDLGTKEVLASTNVSNRLLDRPMKVVEGGTFDEGSQISRSLLRLRKTVEDLDPARQGDLFAPNRFLGIIPFGNRMHSYFRKYQSSQTQINAIISTLNRGQDELRKDNITIEQEKANLWNLMQRLQQYVYVGEKIEDALQVRLDEIETNDPEKARLVREEMLFYLRQKMEDLLTQLAVDVQAYLALDMIRGNNLELMKGVDRAITTTVAALRTAVMVAQALTNQKLVLDQVKALNTTTSNIIENTATLLNKQTGEIHKQAFEAVVNLEQLRSAFANVYATMDMISHYKVEALQVMRKTIDELSQEVLKARAYLDRIRAEEIARGQTKSDQNVKK